MQNKQGSQEQVTLSTTSQAGYQMINDNESSQRSQEFLCFHIAALVDPWEHIFCPSCKICRLNQTTNTTCLPQSALILKYQKYCIELFPGQQMIRVHIPPPSISSKHKEPLKPRCPTAKLKLSDCVTWSTSHQILAQNIILSRPASRNLKTMIAKQREVDQKYLGVWSKNPTSSGLFVLYIAQWTAGKTPL